jgi:outer membrane protein assembly factor BamA
MQKSAIALVVLLLAPSLVAQPSNPPHQVVISNLTLTGVTHLSTFDLQSIAMEVRGSCCFRSQSEEIRQRIVFAFEERGYFKATVDQIDVTPFQQVGNGQAISVSVTVSEGQQYRLSEIAFAGGKVFPTDQLRRLFVIANGDIFNTEKIRVGLDDLRKLYSSHGYINFTPVPNTQTDDEKADISLLIDLDEGKQFHFGKLVLDGEEPQAGTGARLVAAWKPYEGKLFNPEILDQFWQEIEPLMPAGTRQEKDLKFKELPDSALILPEVAFPNTK